MMMRVTVARHEAMGRAWVGQGEGPEHDQQEVQHRHLWVVGVSTLPQAPCPLPQRLGPRGCASMSILTSFRATHTVYRSYQLEDVQLQQRRTSTCTRVARCPKPVARSSSRSATGPTCWLGEWLRQ